MSLSREQTANVSSGRCAILAEFAGYEREAKANCKINCLETAWWFLG